MIWYIPFCLANLVALGSAAVIAERYLPSRVIAFGDSFTDNGTGAWTVSNHTWPADPAYDGHRFSNGPVWVEYLAQSLSVELESYAIGGATSNNSVVQGFTGRGSTIPDPSMLDQVAEFIQHDQISSRDLFVILIGANDAFFGGGSVDSIIRAITAAIEELRAKGATRFLVGSYPDLGRIPLQAFEAQAANNELSEFSRELSASVENLWRQLCQANVQTGFVDNLALFDELLAEPSVFGFDPADTGRSCLVGAYKEVPRRMLCDDPDDYIFWDEYHPTTMAHKRVGELALKASQTLCKGSG